MNKFHDVQDVRFVAYRMILVVDGRERSFALSQVSKRLAAASLQERQNFQIAPSGYGIHWPLLDEDLSIDGLLEIRRKPISKRSLKPVNL